MSMMPLKCPKCGADLMHIRRSSVIAAGSGTCADCGTAYNWSMTPSGPVATVKA